MKVANLSYYRYSLLILFSLLFVNIPMMSNVIEQEITFNSTSEYSASELYSTVFTQKCEKIEIYVRENEFFSYFQNGSIKVYSLNVGNEKFELIRQSTSIPEEKYKFATPIGIYKVDIELFNITEPVEMVIRRFGLPNEIILFNSLMTISFVILALLEVLKRYSILRL